MTKATRLKGIKDFSAKNFGLNPIEVEKWGPFLFLNFSTHQKRNLSSDFQMVESSLKTEENEDFLTEMKFIKKITYDVPCNWKVCVLFLSANIGLLAF